MKKIILSALFGIAFFGISCEKCNKPPQSDCVAEYIEGSVWTQEWDPVCGCDGETYSNAAHAEAYSITDYTEGECGSK